MPTVPTDSTAPSPPRRRFTYFDGNFDYPPAPTSAVRTPRTGRLDTGSEAEATGHTEAQTAVAFSEENQMPPPRTATTRSRFPPSYAAESDGQDREEPVDDLPALQPPGDVQPRNMTRFSRYLHRSRARLQAERSADVDMDAADLLDTLSDMPLPPGGRRRSLWDVGPSSSGAGRRSPWDEPHVPSRTAKRRRLEHGTHQVSPWDGFRYGYRGQVVPGRLKMEIVSCDGGEYQKSTPYGLYPIQNVLKNDKSVYCSERSSCNLLLKHIGEAPFSLEKVVIRAPDRGFTAPVQEGLVFVAMSSDDILSGTSSYEIEYSSPSPAPSESQSSSRPSTGEQLLSLTEAMADPYILEQSQARNGDDAPTDRTRERGRVEDHPHHLVDFGDSGDDVDEDSYNGIAAVSAPTPPPFTITTESEEESDENEETTEANVMADRLRRETRWRLESDDEEEDHHPPRRFAWTPGDYGFRRGHWRRERECEQPIRARQRLTPSRIEPKEPPSNDKPLITPHAKFFIAKHKSKITIKFHPAVSGRFVLLKFWSPTHDGNIDIESVQFYGYSGPRFFPAVQMR
ncbi:uncharacterized protein EI97DRAFT_434442 [Westerdykella ornata]|uniref:Uncharacterized protein n=1 Tax=Westerdykella ornata TaxID=318751 RepID=A0A6A6JG09_WESOR|nr:uncharacterized protein EI97DRAFT_434442 [Westerdykella ornata]KAF2275205.1 hypothetical protein EI97DRAFT_434442 [Westerdykella ornata]